MITVSVPTRTSLLPVAQVLGKRKIRKRKAVTRVVK